MSFVIPLSRNGPPLSQQIFHCFRREILRGTLGGSERLPSTRELAEALHVSRTVVLLAYEQLLAEGYITSRTGSATFVTDGWNAGREDDAATSAKVRLSRFGCSAGAVAEPVALSPRLRSLLVDDLDPLLDLAGDGLSLAIALPDRWAPAARAPGPT